MKNTLLALALISISSVGCAQIGVSVDAPIGRHGSVTIQGSVPIYTAPAPVYVYPPAIAVQPRGYPPGYHPPYVYGSPSMYDPCAGEQYIDGVYNPPAAQAYCRGRQDRAQNLQRQYEADAYHRGRKGY